jgi:hypothetical protein
LLKFSLEDLMDRITNNPDAVDPEFPELAQPAPDGRTTDSEEEFDAIDDDDEDEDDVEPDDDDLEAAADAEDDGVDDI